MWAGRSHTLAAVGQKRAAKARGCTNITLTQALQLWFYSWLVLEVWKTFCGVQTTEPYPGGSSAGLAAYTSPEGVAGFLSAECPLPAGLIQSFHCPGESELPGHLQDV